MRVLVVGAAGAVGRATARTLAALDSIDGLTLADLDAGGVEALAGELGPVADAQVLDITDGAALRRCLHEHDVVVNTVGPYWLSAEQVLDAAIETRVAYLDACDDSAVTVRLLQRRAIARETGVTAVIGMGLSPGLSNLLAVTAARELEQIDTLRTGWSVDAGEGGFRTNDDLVPRDLEQNPAALLAWLERIRDDIVIAELDPPAVLRTMEPVHLHYPGIGSGTGWTSGHPEGLTLAASLGIEGPCENVMVMQRRTAQLLLSVRSRLQDGRLSLHNAALTVMDPTIIDRLRSWTGIAQLPGGGGLPAFFAVAEGTRDGEQLRVGAQLVTLPSGLDLAAGTTLALTADIIGGEQAGRGGVRPPELAVEPDILFGRLAPWCEPPVPTGTLLDVSVEPF